MKKINVADITNAVANMCIEANTHIGQDIVWAMETMRTHEISSNGQEILSQMLENFKIAKKTDDPICQDTGMVVCFVTFGQEVYIEGGSLEEAIQKGVREGYRLGSLRNSIVNDPITRVNTKDNTPAIVHYRIEPGDTLKLQLTCKGFGSENTSALKMLKPSEGIDGVEDFVVDTVCEKGGNACPPIVVGVGIGGDFEKSAMIAKEALLRPVNSHHQLKHIRDLEDRILTRCNNLGIGPMGLGGIATVLGVNVNTFPTHIAGLPVAVNICCYVNRHVERTF